MSDETDHAAAQAGAYAMASERLSRLGLVGHALNGPLSVQEALHIVIAQAAVVVGRAGGVLALVNSDDTLQLVAWEGLNQAQVERFGQVKLTDPVPIAEAARTGEAVFVSSAAERDDRYPEIEKVKDRTAASASLPLCLNGSVVGVLGVGCYGSFDFTPADRLFLAALAEQCASFLGRVGYVASYPSMMATPAAAQLLDTLVKNAPVGFAYVDTDLNFVMVNDALADLSGWPAAEHVGRAMAEMMPALAAAHGDRWRAVLKSGQSVRGLEVDVDVAGSADDRRSWIADYFPVALAEGTIVGFGATIVDVTERNRLASLLLVAEQREAQNRFRGAMDAMLDLVTLESPVYDDDGKIVDFVIEYMNRAQLDAAGPGADEVVGRRLLEVYPMVVDELFAMYRQVMATGRPAVIEQLPYEHVIDGVTVRGFYVLQVVRHGVGILITSRDITESLRVQIELRSAYKRLATAQRLAHVGSWRLVVGTDRIDCSDEYFRICGVDPAHPTGLANREQMERIVHPDDRDELVARYTQALVDHHPFSLQHRIIRPDGSVRTVVVHADVVLDDSLAVVEIWGATQDVTEQLDVQRALQTASTKLSEEQSTVEMLQAIIVPQMPEVPDVVLRGVYLPAEQSLVGGDWYDAFALPGGSIGLVVGDVAGHGVGAAAMMTQVRNALRAFATLHDDPSLTLRRVNDLLAATDDSRFVTCFYGVFDPRTDRLCWSSGGHPPPLVRRGGDTFYLSNVLGPPIGAIAGAEYETETTQLVHGDSLVLYTDGLVERRREAIDVGLDRLRHLVQALDTDRDDFLATVANAMTGGSARPDDICILALTILDWQTVD